MHIKPPWVGNYTSFPFWNSWEYHYVCSIPRGHTGLQGTGYVEHQWEQAEITAREWRCGQASDQLNEQMHFFFSFESKSHFFQKSVFEQKKKIPEEAAKRTLSCRLWQFRPSLLIWLGPNFDVCSSFFAEEAYVFSLFLWSPRLLTSHCMCSMAHTFCVLQEDLWDVL